MNLFSYIERSTSRIRFLPAEMLQKQAEVVYPFLYPQAEMNFRQKEIDFLRSFFFSYREKYQQNSIFTSRNASNISRGRLSTSLSSSRNEFSIERNRFSSFIFFCHIQRSTSRIRFLPAEMLQIQADILHPFLYLQAEMNIRQKEIDFLHSFFFVIYSEVQVEFDFHQQKCFK